MDDEEQWPGKPMSPAWHYAQADSIIRGWQNGINDPWWLTKAQVYATLAAAPAPPAVRPIQADAENLGDATYVYLSGQSGIPDGIHQVRIGDRKIRLYVNAARPLRGTGGESTEEG